MSLCAFVHSCHIHTQQSDDSIQMLVNLFYSQIIYYAIIIETAKIKHFI